MKKSLCLVLLLTMFAGLTLSTGCGGGDGGVDGLTAILSLVAFTVAISASGGSATTAFTASYRAERPALSVLSATPSTKFKARVVQLASGSAGTTSNTDLSFENNVLTGIAAMTGYPGNKVEYRVEIVSRVIADAKPILKQVVNDVVSEGKVIPTTVSALSTAEAMVYESWISKAENNNRTFENFKMNVPATGTAAIVALAAQVDNEFAAAANAGNVATYTPSTALNDKAVNIASGVPVEK
ncbi:MAG: hypothetical protein WA705_06450 [Candidatus Ozemobacteraceae bacterium]